MKAILQATSPVRGDHRLPTMPLIPAIRPLVSHNKAAESPIRVPPIAAETGVKCSIRPLPETSLPLDYAMRRTAINPVIWWSVTWRWNIQLPGLSATEIFEQRDRAQHEHHRD